MTASISAHSTNIASTIIHAYAYHYNLSLCMCHVQPTVYQRNSYCIRDIHVTEAIRSYTPISRAPLIYGILFTHADILIFPVLALLSALIIYHYCLQRLVTSLRFVNTNPLTLNCTEAHVTCHKSLRKCSGRGILTSDCNDW